MSDGSPWADPSTPTQPGVPYAGPPPTVPPGSGPGYIPYGHASYGHASYGYTSYGYPPGHPAPWPPVPRGPRRPGQVIAAAVLAFVQGGLVLVSSVYVLFLASFVGFAASLAVDRDGGGGLATEGLVVAVVQVVSAVLLVTGGVMALNTRRRPALVVLVTAFAVQVALCLYWAVRIPTVAAQIPGDDPAGAFLSFVLLFAAGPVVGLGLLLTGAGRGWFEPAPVRAAAA